MEPINLFKQPRRFGELPHTAKMGILTLFGGWLVHFTIIYSVFRDLVTDNMILQHAGLAVITCFVLLKLKNWARILCITGNAIVLVFYLLLISIVGGSQGAVAVGLVLVNLALFGSSTYFLLAPASAAFFKQQSVKPPRRPPNKVRERPSVVAPGCREGADFIEKRFNGFESKADRVQVRQRGRSRW